MCDDINVVNDVLCAGDCRHENNEVMMIYAAILIVFDTR